MSSPHFFYNNADRLPRYRHILILFYSQLEIATNMIFIRYTVLILISVICCKKYLIWRLSYKIEVFISYDLWYTHLICLIMAVFNLIRQVIRVIWLYGYTYKQEGSFTCSSLFLGPMKFLPGNFIKRKLSVITSLFLLLKYPVFLWQASIKGVFILATLLGIKNPWPYYMVIRGKGGIQFTATIPDYSHSYTI